MKNRLIARVLLLVLLFSPAVAAAGQVYRCVSDGGITYSAKAIKGTECKVIFFTLESGWTVVSASDSVVVSTYDSSVVRRKDGVKVWVMYSYQENQEDRGRYYRSSKELDVYDCHATTVSTLTTIEYLGQHGDGRVMASYQYRNPVPTYIAPETIGSAIFDKFCPAGASAK